MQTIQDNTVWLVTVKNYIEVCLVPLALVAWIFSWCAPVLGIILVQAIRIKYLGSNFTRKVLKSLDGQLAKVLPGFVYTNVVVPTKNFLSSLSGVKEAL